MEIVKKVQPSKGLSWLLFRLPLHLYRLGLGLPGSSLARTCDTCASTVGAVMPTPSMMSAFDRPRVVVEIALGTTAGCGA